MRFYLGTHRANWLERTDVPLFLSNRILAPRRTLPEARGPWALDSGGFSEISMYGEWRTTEREYVASVRRYADEIGKLEWVAPQDWMCEPAMLVRTGLTVAEHQRRTIGNFLALRDRLGGLVVPVLQGWEPDDYLRHAWDYGGAGVDLASERLVGIGSVCRRRDARLVLRALAEFRLHGFGLKSATLAACSDVLVSADSMAWSYRARRDVSLPGCTHKTCANCIRFALRWREGVIRRLDQLRLEVPCAA